MTSNPYGPLDKARLSAFEHRLGTTLPEEYRNYLIQHNGAVLTSSVFVLPGRTEPFALMNEQTFGLHEGPGAQLDLVYDNCLEYLPASLVAFAEDTAGDLFCIDTAGDRRGRVYFWDHERPYCGDAEPKFENVRLQFVADSFVEFLDRLRPE